MLQTLRIIAVLAGLALAYDGYQAGKDGSPDPSPTPTPVVTPDTPIKITIDGNEAIPPAPTGTVAEASLPIKTTLLTKGTALDSIKLARTFRSWAELLARKPGLKTTSDFRNAYIAANTVLFTRHGSAGKWGNSLNEAFDKTLVASFANKGLVENGAIKAAAWSPEAASAAEEAFNAISYQCFQAFLEQSTKPKT